jgi:protein-S-isoprenylcysteine O-methyltransferase Ste14
MSAALASGDAGAWRHVRAIALLPFMNTVVIPSILLESWPALPLERGTAAVAVTAIGLVLVAAGAALVVHSVRLFVRLGRGTLAPWDPTRALVAAGAYRYTRNPMKAGLFLVLAGEALATRSAALAVWLGAFALANMVYIRLHEEPGLERRFGERYREYCARVPRWLPRLSALRNATKETTTP